jgi:hypothetical protein
MEPATLELATIDSATKHLAKIVHSTLDSTSMVPATIDLETMETTIMYFATMHSATLDHEDMDPATVAPQRWI